MKVLIYGAGSIGNHMAYACRSKKWDVMICDIDPEALRRCKSDIYPSRYKQWDEEIQLVQAAAIPKDTFDLVIIGTPPDTHVKLVLDILQSNPPRVMLIEKPLGVPGLDSLQVLFELAQSLSTIILIGYNHTLTENTRMAGELIEQNYLGKPLAINVRWLEHWGGIFHAHPWLAGPADSYLGYSHRGGGASCEHSHGINLWQHFARLSNKGRITEVTAKLDLVSGKSEYDRNCYVFAKTENGLIGTINQDVITEPAVKTLRLQAEKGFIEWYANYDTQHDALIYTAPDGTIKQNLIRKTRPDDFKGEIDHVEQLLTNKIGDSPISLKAGLDTMLVIAAIYISNSLGKAVGIDYTKGYQPAALIY